MTWWVVLLVALIAWAVGYIEGVRERRTWWRQ